MNKECGGPLLMLINRLWRFARINTLAIYSPFKKVRGGGERFLKDSSTLVRINR